MDESEKLTQDRLNTYKGVRKRMKPYRCEKDEEKGDAEWNENKLQIWALWTASVNSPFQSTKLYQIHHFQILNSSTQKEVRVGIKNEKNGEVTKAIRAKQTHRFVQFLLRIFWANIPCSRSSSEIKTQRNLEIQNAKLIYTERGTCT